MEQNIYMKRLIPYFIICIFFFSSAGAQAAKSVSPENAEIINQINQSLDADEYSELDEDDIKSMGYGINPSDTKQELEQKYEESAVNLKIEDKTAQEKFDERSQKVFKLGAEKYSDYSVLKTQNMFWDTSENFQKLYYQDYKNRLYLPNMLNSSYITSELNPATSFYVGQRSLSSFDDITVDFVRSNTTTYDVGAKVITRGDSVNFTAGAYNSSLTHLISGGAIIASNPIILPNSMGSFVVGGGYYANEMESDSKNTGGMFAEYRIKRLKLNAEVAKSKYSNTDALETGLYFVPEFQLTDSISVKTRFIKNISQNTNQDEIGLTYKPKKNNPRDLELELNAANTYSDSQVTKQRIRFTATFKL